MANGLIFNICLVLWSVSRAQSCYIPEYLYVDVPQTIQPGYLVTKVHTANCDTASLHFTVDEPGFAVESSGAIVAVSRVSVVKGGRTFSVWAHDNSGLRWQVEVHLVRRTPTIQYSGQDTLLRRYKRRWSPPPLHIIENDNRQMPQDVNEIGSDTAVNRKVYYTFTGPGVNEEPLGVFKLDRITGMLSVHKKVDREQYPSFVLLTRVFDLATNVETDEPLDIKVVVDDENDNNPQFVGELKVTVPEHSRVGTVVGKLNATDLDEPGTKHVQIRFSLLDQVDKFVIDGPTGVLKTATMNLDREVQDTYKVTVKIQDMDGAPDGLFSTGTATVVLGDINDNPPTFKEPSLKATVPENEVEKLILRIPVDDKDLINTPNWKSKFVIAKGNENGNFRMATDPKTNEGLLYATKPLNYELTKSVKLLVRAENEAKLVGTAASWNTVPVDLAVTDVDEGPEFSNSIVYLRVKENTPNGTLIGSNPALDPETKSGANIKYFKTSDPASWINVDKDTAELRVANTIDRESHFVQNGIYNITMKAVDSSSKTGTGTVVIVVEDDNDFAPTLPVGDIVLCEKEGERGSVLLVAEDMDQSPFSAPFSFRLPDDQDGKWALTTLNGTAATLNQMKDLPTGMHSVDVEILDQQGFGKKQAAKVRICRCRNGACLAAQKSVSLGPLSVLATLLSLALLLLLFLLLAFFCSTKGDIIKMPDSGESNGILLKSNTESRGEEVDPKALILPVIGQESDAGETKTGVIGLGEVNGYGTGGGGTGFGQIDGGYGEQWISGNTSQYIGQNSAFLHTWQTNGRYLHQKLGYLGTEDERYAEDIIHSYRFEGEGSAAGSVGCCSEIGEDDSLDFVNTLGPKFKTLAGVCRKT